MKKIKNDKYASEEQDYNKNFTAKNKEKLKRNKLLDDIRNEVQNEMCKQYCEGEVNLEQ